MGVLVDFLVPDIYTGTSFLPPFGPLGMLVHIQVIPRWEDDPVQKQEVEDNEGDGTSDVRRRVWGGIISVRKNKRRILGTEWSMYEVGTPPPNSLDKPHGQVDSINNNNNINIDKEECF